jgi:hypothetical protein
MTVVAGVVAVVPHWNTDVVEGIVVDPNLHEMAEMQKHVVLKGKGVQEEKVVVVAAVVVVVFVVEQGEETKRVTNTSIAIVGESILRLLLMSPCLMLHPRLMLHPLWKGHLATNLILPNQHQNLLRHIQIHIQRHFHP